MSNICPNCQASITENDKFCPKCGQKIVRDEVSPTTHTNEPVQGNDTSSASSTADSEITSNSENTPVDTTNQGNESPKASPVGNPVPQPDGTNMQATATSQEASFLQSRTFAKIVGVCGMISVLSWFFSGSGFWIFVICGILGYCLYCIWKEILGNKTPDQFTILATCFLMFIGGLVYSCGTTSVDSEKDVEKIVAGTTWSVTSNTVEGYRGLWLKFEFKKNHTVTCYFANPSEGKWTKLSDDTWQTISGRYVDTGEQYYGVEMNPGKNRMVFKDGSKKGVAMLYWADMEPTLIEEGDNAPW